jgi:cytochrome d ubiquinol oxidase subunit II
MLAAIGPLWYANETWLVIAGAILFAAFPVAYGVILSSLYIPAMGLIFGLILRAVSIELRGHSQNKAPWGVAIGIASLIAALAQGFLLGGLLGQPRVVDGAFAGGPWDWLSATSVVIAFGVAVGYTLLGAARLMDKAPGEAAARDRRLLRASTIGAVVLFVAAAALRELGRHSAPPMGAQPARLLLVGLCLVVGIASFIMLLRASRRSAPSRATYALGIVMVLSAAGATIATTFPYLIPYSLTIRDAASPRMTLVVMLFGVGFVLPVVIAYNLYTRSVFRGKASEGEAEDNY